MTIAHCPETECIHHNPNGCTADVIWHSTDRFCVSFKRKVDGEYKQLIKNTQPIDFKRCEKDVSN
jgi:hypothetical protein